MVLESLSETKLEEKKLNHKTAADLLFTEIIVLHLLQMKHKIIPTAAAVATTTPGGGEGEN